MCNVINLFCMDREEFMEAVRLLEEKIEFNKRIKCLRVAARYERALEKFKEEYGRECD